LKHADVVAVAVIVAVVVVNATKIVFFP